MKSIKHSFRLLLTIISISGVMLIGCKGKQTDAEIQASINEKIASKEEMKGLNASVSNGVVTVTGECPTEECKRDCAEAIKGVKGVKEVNNNIQVASISTAPAPVEIAGDETLKSSVNDVVKGYDGVQADVKDGVVTLRGTVQRDKLKDLIIAVNELKPRKVDNQLVIK